MNKLFSFNIVYLYLRVAFDVLPHILIAKLIQLGLSVMSHDAERQEKRLMKNREIIDVNRKTTHELTHNHALSPVLFQSSVS